MCAGKWWRAEHMCDHRQKILLVSNHLTLPNKAVGIPSSGEMDHGSVAIIFAHPSAAARAPRLAGLVELRHVPPDANDRLSTVLH